MDPIVEMKGIYKSFGGVPVLQNVDFSVYPGEIVALCGENGAGKSTLMKILAAVYTADSGTIEVKGQPLPKKCSSMDMQRLGISMIHQELDLIPEMTVAQNIFLSREPVGKLGWIDFKTMNRKARELLKNFGENISPSAKVNTLKIAQKQMVEIAKAISFDVKVLIMDEPTAVLTPRETQTLFDLMKSLVSQGIGVVYISHRLQEIKVVADRVTVLRDGIFVASKRVDEVTERDIAKLMVGREVSESVARDFTGDPNDIVLEVKNISADMLHDVSFSVAKGEILGFSGLIGAGRSELMEVIFGLRKCKKGQILLNGKPLTIKNAREAIACNLSFATEDRKETGLVTCRSVAENIDYVYRVKSRGIVCLPRAVRARAQKMARDLKLKFKDYRQPVESLSGGNQQKVVLSKWLLVAPDILIIDEPTRGIDVGARAEIYQIINRLADEGKTIIIVSSDLTEVLNTCQRIIVMHEGSITGVLTGGERTEENVMNCAANV